jgi:hypothetical protein
VKCATFTRLRNRGDFVQCCEILQNLHLHLIKWAFVLFFGRKFRVWKYKFVEILSRILGEMLYLKYVVFDETGNWIFLRKGNSNSRNSIFEFGKICKKIGLNQCSILTKVCEIFEIDG